MKRIVKFVFIVCLVFFAGIFIFTACDYIRKPTSTHVHTKVIDSAVAPTCTKTGLTTGVHCSECNEVIVAQEEVPALDHPSVVIDSAVLPTCMTSGLTSGTHCSVCNEIFTPQRVVQALGHTIVIDEAIVPTCAKTGLTTGAHCSVCDETLVKQNVVATLRHNFVDHMCTMCGIGGASEGLEYELSSDGKSYIVSGLGTCTYSDVLIPSTYNDLPVTSIAEDAFYKCENLTSIKISEGVTKIGRYAFGSCTSLTNVIVPNSVISIDDLAFSNCTSLTNIAIPSDITSIGWYAFDECSNLKFNEYDNAYYLGNDIDPYVVLFKAKNTDIASCAIHDNTKVIYDFAFNGCNDLENIYIPDRVAGIGYYSFNGCSSLTNLTIPDSVTSIGDYSFSYCRNLISVSVGKSVTKISQWMFFGCSNLSSVSIPDSVTYIGSEAFRGCSALESIVIPDSVTEMGAAIFEGCSKLNNVILPDNLKTLHNFTFFNCLNLNTITISKGLVYIGYSVFEQCNSLDSVIFIGTVEQWNNIEKEDSWNTGTGSYTIYCTDGTIAKDGTVTYYPKEEENLYTRDGDYIYFGEYPQSNVTDTTLTEALNATASSDGWISYEYYIEGSNTTDFMWYQDVIYGGERYRGVYFTSYRPYYTIYSSSADNTYQDDNDYTLNTADTAYWFKWEPLLWTILDEEDGKSLLLCASIIDSMEYYDNYSLRTIDGETVYPNNYAASSIRAWLNSTFYETAFRELQQAIILTTEVDNSAKSTIPYEDETHYNNGGVNDYAGENTYDKIFLLSREDVTNSNYCFSSLFFDTTRTKQTSDYAQCQGCNTCNGGTFDSNGDWWLRSPYYDYSSCVYIVDYAGSASHGLNVCYSLYGIVPALWIEL